MCSRRRLRQLGYVGLYRIAVAINQLYSLVIENSHPHKERPVCADRRDPRVFGGRVYVAFRNDLQGILIFAQPGGKIFDLFSASKTSHSPVQVLSLNPSM